MQFLKEDDTAEDKPSQEEQEEFVFSDLKYIMEFTKIISALKQGCDITQLSSGYAIISQTRVLHTHLKWDKDNKKFSKLMQYYSK